MIGSLGWAGASLVGVPALAVSLLGGAGVASGTDAGAGDGVRWEAACSRIPQRVERVEQVQHRIQGSAETKGSIAFLEARIERQRQAGHDDAVRLLENRLAVRKDVAAMLPDVLTRLHDAQQVCASHLTQSGSASTAPDGTS